MLTGSKKEINGRLIKVRYQVEGKSKNKVFMTVDGDYCKFANKIHEDLKLDTKKYYLLCYLDNEKDQIDINNQQDFNIFIESFSSLILEMHQTQSLERDFSKNIVSKIESSKNQCLNLKRFEQIEADLCNCKRKYEQCQEIIEQQKGQIQQLRQKTKEDIINEKKKELAIQLEQYKEQLRVKFTLLMEENLKEQILIMKGQPKGNKVSKYEQREEEIPQKARNLMEILSISKSQAEDLVNSHPKANLQALITLHYH